MISIESIRRLDAIIDGASKLPVQTQETILITIQGIVTSRNQHIKQAGVLLPNCHKWNDKK